MARKILLADDSVTAQNMGKKILSDAGYEVATVSNGSAALKRVQEHPPDLIVLDVYMPGYSGLEVCRRLKESANTAHIPVLLTVGKLEPFRPDEARKARAEAFVVKPFEATELIAMVKRLETEPPKIKPEPDPKASRKKKGLASVFASSELAETPDPNTEIDEAGWRDRLSIPNKNHQETEEAPEVATWGTGFRDLSPVEPDTSRRDSAFTAEPFVASAIPPTPQDATPEEIAALQAAAAALMGGGAPAATTEKAAAVEVAPAPASEAAPPPTKASSNAADAQSPAENKTVATETTPVHASVTAETETKPADSVVKAARTLVEEPGVIDQSEEPLFASDLAAKIEVSAPSAKEEASETLEETTSSPVTTEASAKAEIEPEIAAEVAPSPVAAEGVVKAEEVTPSPVTAEAVVKAEATPEATPQEKEAETQPAVVMAASTSVVSQHWVALSALVDSVEASLSLDQEMAQFRAVAAAVEGSARPVIVGASAVAVAETEFEVTPAPAAGSQHVAEETSVPVVVEVARAAAAGAGIEAGPDVTPSPVAAPETSVAEAEMDNKSASEMKAAWANWREIRESIVGSNLSREVVDLASSVAETPHTSPAKEQDKPASIGDPAAIASIVDSVLAELKPRIVEEIARKLKKD